MSSDDRAEGKEGLIGRARRLFGEGSASTLQPGRTRRSQGGADHGQDEESPYQKRRRQVRAAQKNHRERKENYIKALEQEVIDLRRGRSDREQALEKEVQFLRGVLRDYGLEAPSYPPPTLEVTDTDLDDVYGTGMQLATVSYREPIPGLFATSSSENQNAQALRVSLPGSSQSSLVTGGGGGQSSASYAASHTSSYTEPPMGGPGVADIPSAKPPIINQDSNVSTVRSNSLDTQSTAIDFILTLEHPCMAHSAYNQPIGTGHGLTASSHLLAAGPPAARAGGLGAQSLTWTVPQADVERLLELSDKIDLDGEVTPVQAWHRLRRHPKFQNIDSGTLEGFKMSLATRVTCQGFGAVLDEYDFEMAVHQLFDDG